MRQMLVDYAAAYRRGGAMEMATYEDKETPLAAAAELDKVVSASPYLLEYAPALQRYMAEYPNATLAEAEDLFYWTKDKFGPKPTIAIHHLTLWNDPDDPAVTVVACKQIYASHYFRAGLELNVLVDAPEPGGGFYLLDLYRARIDPPTGLLSGVLLGKIHGGVEQGVAEWLKAAKARAEGR
jgi:hypothetical protein